MRENITEKDLLTKRVEYLDKQITKQIKNLFVRDFSKIKYVEELPFTFFHIIFKKNILETLTISLAKQKKLKTNELNKIYKMFNIKTKPQEFAGIKIELFKKNPKKNLCGFDFERFKQYTELLIDILIKNEIYTVSEIILKTNPDTEYDDEYEIELLVNVVDEIKSFAEPYKWVEVQDRTVNNEVFYHTNSFVENDFYIWKGVVDSLDETNISNRKRFLQNFTMNSNTRYSKAEDEVRSYYKNIYYTLIKEDSEIDILDVIGILNNTLSGLINANIKMRVENALISNDSQNSRLVDSKKELAQMMGQDFGNLGKQLNPLDSRFPSAETLYHLSNILDISFDEILGSKEYFNTENNKFYKTLVDTLYKDFGITETLLRHMGMWRNYETVYGKDTDNPLPFGERFDLMFKNSYLLNGVIDKSSEQFIAIDDETLELCADVMSSGKALKDDDSVATKRNKNSQLKEKNKLRVHWNDKKTIIKCDNIEIEITPLQEIYRLLDKKIMIVRKIGDRKVVLKKNNQKNIIFLKNESSQSLKFNHVTHRIATTGEMETDFLTPLLEFLSPKRTVHEQEHTNQGYEEYINEQLNNNHLSEDLELLEIISRLKNYKKLN